MKRLDPRPDRRADRRLGRRRDSLARGQGIVEYGLIMGLSALLALVLLVFFGGALSAFLQVVGNAIDAAS